MFASRMSKHFRIGLSDSTKAARCPLDLTKVAERVCVGEALVSEHVLLDVEHRRELLFCIGKIATLA